MGGLAALFGIADGGGYLIGVGLGWALMSEAAADVIETGDVRAPRGLPAGRRRRHGADDRPLGRLGLPFALTMDNLTFGLAGEKTGSVAGEALAMPLSSGFLAYLGMFVAAWLPTRAAGQGRGAADRRAPRC